MNSDNWDTNENLDPEEQFPRDFRQGSSGRRPHPKKRKKRKRKKKYYLLKLLILIAVCIGIYFLLHSSLFNIQEIKVKGNSHFKTETVQKMSGIKKGDNSFELKMGDIEEKLEQDPYIREAEVKRMLPKGVMISLQERKAQAAVKYDGRYYLLDRSGVVVDSRKKRPHVTQFLNLHVTKAENGEKLKVKEDAALAKQLELLKTMEEGNLYFKKVRITGVMARIYIKDKLICRGKVQNIITNIKNGNLQKVLYHLDKKGKTKGMINIGDDQYCSYRPKLK